MLNNWWSAGGLLTGIAGSATALAISCQFIFGDAFRGLDFLLFLLILLPACFALITSFVPAPLILIAFVWSLPLSVYLWVASNVEWFALTCAVYLLSAALKFKGSRVAF
ncbi:hypothetical protein EDM54_18010 [Brevibacillus borstelensis]|uniref:hypothetical protein n=1 Tax=Brevibacillus borstelensis TaxID=45462 RepID=UPI000F0924A0|nr:hypothetical protein [Brevibacillus borstelensis]MCM3469355.1 hypothetical protein [Brevibacillus borstelensis]MCM3622363.1 hypothetical protein [Brevibacillus borstelensis]MED1884497.1 hypothetical protein [Brevibacillus borstelensis]RNB60997.1 hypothetical protein EDM54_18010 [Brevibacillus borstelensis]GED52597.1 hypothetical protein BBO01nite_18380 [Brevibacillus borstelensis]